MLANGEFIEVEAALPEAAVARMGLEYRQGPPPALEPAVDDHGVRSKSRHNPLEKVRGRIGAFIYEPDVEPLTNGNGNGHGTNGHGTNGHSSNGHALNGHADGELPAADQTELTAGHAD
jgi:hypothetical protein